MPAHQLPAQAVRDLDWVLTSPSLIRPIPQARLIGADLSSATRHWLQQLYDAPTPLLTHLQQRDTHFLGSYFESLWEFWLRNQPQLQLVSQRQQIYDQGKTLGEFDFIIWDESQQTYRHQELAVKFYLGFMSPGEPRSPSTGQEALWIGPNAADRLDLKLAKLQTQQLRLRDHPVAQHWLHSQGIQAIEPELLLKGYLFTPLEVSLEPPAVAGDQHLQGRWLYLAQLEQLQPLGKHWLVLDKASWLSPAHALEEQLLSFAQLRAKLRQHFATDSRALLLAAMDEQGDHWRESDRYFVVPDHWPQQPHHKRPNRSI